MRDKAADSDTRTSCVLIGMALDHWNPDFAGEAARLAVATAEMEEFPRLFNNDVGIADWRERLARQFMDSLAITGLASRALELETNPAAKEALARLELNEILSPVDPQRVPDLPPDDAHAAANREARGFVRAMAKASNPLSVAVLAAAAADLGRRMRPEDAGETAADAAGEAVRWLDPSSIGSPDYAPDQHFSDDLISALRLLVPQVRPLDAARIALQATPKPHGLHGDELARVVAILAPRLRPADAMVVTRKVIEAMIHADESSERDALADAETALIADSGPGDSLRRIRTVVAAAGNAPAPFGGLVPLAESSRPLSGRFTDQQLVDLLKTPICRRERGR